MAFLRTTPHLTTAYTCHPSRTFLPSAHADGGSTISCHPTASRDPLTRAAANGAYGHRTKLPPTHAAPRRATALGAFASCGTVARAGCSAADAPFTSVPPIACTTIANTAYTHAVRATESAVAARVADASCAATRAPSNPTATSRSCRPVGGSIH